MTDSRRRQPGPSRIGSTLFAVGCLGVLGLTFMVGFYSGRYWTRASLPAAIPDAPAVAGTPPVRRGASAVAASPALTFYEELRAPLPAAPAPSRVTPSEPRRPVERAESVAARADDRTVRSDKRGADESARRGEPIAAPPRFTVQVAAYSAKTSAEALRNTMTASGHQAYIVESEGPPGAPRYRVRVGSYPSREAAIAAAARLPVPGARYVTTR